MLNKINTNLFSKISFILLLIWILTPIFTMILTPLVGNWNARNIIYINLIIIGFLGIFMSVVFFLKKRDFKKILDDYLPIILFFVLLLWCVLTSFTSIDKTVSFLGTGYRKDGLLSYFSYFGLFCLPIMLKKEKNIDILINVLIIVQVIIAFISLLDNNITYLLMENNLPFTAIFSNSNHYGYYLIFGVLLSLILFLHSKIKIKILYFIAYLLLLYVLLMNDTFGCILAIIFSLLVIVIRFFANNKKEIFVVLVSTLLVFLIAQKGGQNIVYNNFKSLLADFGLILEIKENVNNINSVGSSRGELWKHGLDYIKEKPILGYGIETLGEVYVKDEIEQDRPHNMLIQFAAFTGIPGLILYLIFIFSILYRVIILRKKLNIKVLGMAIVCTCYFVSSMFGNSMFYTSPYFLLFLGILNSYLKNNNIENKI